MQEKDTMRELCVQQGYVPATCILDGMIIIGLINKGKSPCDGCNANRDICKRKRKSYENYTETGQIMSLLDKMNEFDREQQEEQRRRYEEMVRQRKEGHINGYTRTILEVRWDYINSRECKIEIIVKDIVDEKAYYTRCQYISEALSIIQYACAVYKVEQIHVEETGLGAALYDDIKSLKLENVDIVPLRYVAMKL